MLVGYMRVSSESDRQTTNLQRDALRCNGRATVECRIDELKNELAADHFCLRSFFATESAFLAVLFGFNLLGEFQRAVDPALKTYKQPATLRFEVFTCGAILGRSGHHLVLNVSKNWGGYSSRKSLFNSLLHWPPPTFSEVRSLNKKCRMKSIDLAAQLRNLGLVAPMHGYGLVSCRRQKMNSQIDSLEPNSFDWPLAYEAEGLLRRFVLSFLEHNQFANRLAGEMQQRTGTDFYEWVDHFTVDPQHAEELRAVGLIRETVEAPAKTEAYYHPRAMMPRVLLQSGGGAGAVPANLAIRTDSLADFLGRQNLATEIDGEFGAGLRQALFSNEANRRFLGVERLGYRGFMIDSAAPKRVGAVIKARELWRARKRDFGHDAEGVAHALDLQKQAIDLVGPDIACDLFFAEERSYWERRNRAARIQKRRQDSLGLGWSNHDHHTFRCSRLFFADLVEFLLRFGFQKRERYYAGAEAGWGAQILEHFISGITVFADVDLMPEETGIDFSIERLAEAPRLSTVGLWCGLHGDSLLQAGMHHLEARFDFSLLREQLAAEGVQTMKPFSDFVFLKQAFTEGERWQVNPGRVKALLAKKLITQEQADGFIKTGAIGSHLENLQRKGGFKGFNQESVSAIIEATDPRALHLSLAGLEERHGRP